MDVVQKSLRSCSESLIMGHGHGINGRGAAAGPLDILMASLSRLLLKDVNDLGLFKSLRICSLPDNFITTIDALAECVHLVKLDLKGNQIVQLPDASFWGTLGQLQLLNLHDNHMETIQSIQGLAGCPALTGLTLHDTPFSLKGDYRCTVVYSICSLRALDCHVISDQELASLHFPPKFQAFSPNLLVTLTGPSVPQDHYQSEIKSVQKILSKIHRIQATYSPVLIIQRWIRGHLTRKRLGLVHDAPQSERKKRPTLTVDSAAEQTTEPHGVKECLVEGEMQRLENHDVKPKRITLNLSKLLQAGSAEVSQTERPAEAKSKKDPPPSTPQDQQSEPCASPEAVRGRKPREDPEVWTFPARSFKASLINLHPLGDTLPVWGRRCQDSRSTTRRFHSGQENKPRPSTQNAGFSAGVQTDTSEKRWMACPQGAPRGRGIDRGKLSETRAQIAALRTELVNRSLERRRGARDARQSHMERRRGEAAWRREQDGARVEAAMAETRASLDREVEGARRRHLVFLEEKKRAASEREMEREFSWRHASVSKTVNKYCTQQAACALQQERSQSVVRSKVQSGSPQRKPVQDDSQKIRDEDDQMHGLCMRGFHAGRKGQ